MSKKIFFSVGEPSGDLHAAKLISCLNEMSPGVETIGLGGPKMEAEGCKVTYPLTQLAVVGFVEVLPKLREFFRVADLAAETMDREKPDAIVLVDFPGFNWHIARRAKERDIPVYYFLPPQLWAWGSWRVNKLRRLVDHVYCNLPFEAQWYLKNSVPNEYVGHPFFDEVREKVIDDSIVKNVRASGSKTIAVLPGSRNREVKSIWPMQLDVLKELASRHPTASFHVACLRNEHRNMCQQVLQAHAASSIEDRIHFHVGCTSELIEACDCSLMKSGSVSLEMMARGTPAVVVYHVSRSLYAASRILANVDSMTLPNLIAGKTVMPEFLAVARTESATEKAIAAMDRLLADPHEHERQRSQLEELAEKYAVPGAARRTASSILKRLGEQVHVNSTEPTIIGAKRAA